VRVAWNACSNGIYVQRTENWLSLWLGHLYVCMRWFPKKDALADKEAG
jgi:hypothetical protein